MLLLTIYVEFRVVAGRRRTPTGRPHIVSGRPMLIYTCHAMPMPRCAVALRSRFQNGMVVAWHGRGMTCVNQTRSHCVDQMGKTQSKPSAKRHGRRAAWEWHGVCELTLTLPSGDPNLEGKRYFSLRRNVQIDFGSHPAYFSVFTAVLFGRGRATCV
jgi:hypothetical protein